MSDEAIEAFYNYDVLGLPVQLEPDEINNNLEPLHEFNSAKPF